MQSHSHFLNFMITLKDNSDGTIIKVSQEAQIGGISITQFALFSFGLVQMNDLSKQSFFGRFHSNGDVCFGARPSFNVQKMTSAGTIRPAKEYCQPSGFSFNYVSNISVDGNMNNVLPLTGEMVECTNCLGTGKSWPEFALERWNGNLQDKTHGVPLLNFRDKNGGILQPTTLLQTGLTSGQSSLTKDKMFAYNADIRILNGIWFIRDPANKFNWPGIPIWSDHPGHYQTKYFLSTFLPNDLMVGQDDLRTSLNWGPNTPKKYSFYSWDSSTKTIVPPTSQRGIISYGNIGKDTSGVHVPAHYASDNYCKNKSPAAVCTNCNSSIVSDAKVEVACSTGPISKEANFINATRSGHRVGILQENGSVTGSSKEAASKILPMNFDMAAFQEALSSCSPSDSPGELGCIFSTTGLAGRPFNGIIFIATRWKEPANSAAPNKQADAETRHAGKNTDPNQIPTTSPAQQQSLPIELCSDDRNGEPLDPDGFFRIPKCADYDPALGINAIKTQTDSVRLINASQISKTVFPKGFTFLTTNEIYTVGDINISSDPSSPDSNNWVPALISGYRPMVLSNKWIDSSAPWHLNTVDNTSIRKGSDTKINAAFGSSNYIFFNEQWSGYKLILNGPKLYQFTPSLYGRNISGNFSVTNGKICSLPSIEWKYDKHYELISNSPPGLPFVDVFMILSFIRE